MDAVERYIDRRHAEGFAFVNQASKNKEASSPSIFGRIHSWQSINWK